MKINMPVTDHEVLMSDGVILVTVTDSKGIITKVNDAFIDISGYSEAELIGKNHNVVRHPDMPAEAFSDLWKTVQRGKPWVGIVKNRTKTGDYYWVEANVTAEYKNGQINTLTSCRYAPSREQIRSAESLYEKINNNEVSLDSKGLFDRFNFIKKLNLSSKIIFMSLLMMLPGLVLTGMLYVEKNVVIEFAKKEKQGSIFLVPLKEFLLHTALHRGLTNAYLTQGKTETPAVLQARTLLKKDIEALDKIAAQSGAELKLNQPWQEIKGVWADLEANSQNLTPGQSFSQHSALVSKALDLFITVGDSSNLTFDPKPDSSYLMDLQVLRLPQLMENIGVLRAKASSSINRVESLTQTQITEMGVLKKSINDLLVSISRALDAVVLVNPVLEADFSDKKATLSVASKRFLSGVDGALMETGENSASELFALGTEVITLASKLYNVTSPALQGLLEQRINDTKLDIYKSFAGIIVLIIISAVVGFLLIKYIKKQLEIITRTFARMSEGQFRNKIDLTGHDELGEVLCDLQTMQVQMNVNLSGARTEAIKSMRIQKALDSVDSCVMVANNQCEIIYLNETVQQMFKNAEADIRKQLPDFNADKLLGACIDIFHKEPARQRNLVANLKATMKSNLVIGGRHMDFVANPVRDESGERIGTVVEWVDRTHEVKIEQEIEAIVEAVKVGELGDRIEMADKEGFFEKLSEGINELIDIIDNVFSDVSQTMQSMAKGDLTDRIERDYQGIYLECKNSINTSMDKISEIVAQVNESSDFINNSSQEIASGNNNLSQRAEQQAANLEETASSMEELTSTVKNNADNAQQANQVATTARQLAETGGEIVSSAVSAMQEINESSNKIAEIIGVIDEIAFQTNLLALNASVEAARAGEQGRGFSVVATEVRNLAQRSATAAKESKELIQTSIQKVRAGTEFVNETGKSLNEIVGGVRKVGDIVAEIAAASSEQSQGIEQVNQAVSQMDEITQQNAALAEEASAASVSMSDQSMNMTQLLSFFKVSGQSQSMLSPPVIATVTKPAEERVSTKQSSSSSDSDFISNVDNDEWEDF